MEIGDFLAIAVVGGLLSLAIDSVKKYFGTSSGKTKFLTIVLSVFVGGGYFLLRDTAWWSTILGVLASASTVYALFLKPSN